MKTITSIFSIFIFMFILSSCHESEETVAVQKIVLDKTTLELMVGNSTSLVAKVFPENATNQDIRWSSSASEIAIVDHNGLLTGVSTGKAMITATSVDGSKTAMCEVTIIALKEGITIEPALLRLTIGGEQTLKTTVVVPGDVDPTLKWSSSDEAVASVDKDGKVTALTAGKATITATTTNEKYTNSCDVTVLDLEMKFAEIPAGTFQMGSPETEPGRDSDETKHQVTLSKTFWLSTCEVTNKQYCAFLNINEIGADGKWKDETLDMEQVLVHADPWGVNYDISAREWKPASGKESFPVVSVTWFGAMEFATWLGGKLPTEAQWEYACRGGKAEKPFGLSDGDKFDKTMGNFFWQYPFDVSKEGEYHDNTQSVSKETVTVGSYAANGYGLYDMHGNVFEWCLDWYHSSYGSEDTLTTLIDPSGAQEGTERVLKGGSWYFFSRACRTAFRLQALPERYSNMIGFRVAHF